MEPLVERFYHYLADRPGPKVQEMLPDAVLSLSPRTEKRTVLYLGSMQN
jgi:hypothetical protein